MALTKAEKQILKDYGNDPNYRIETNSRNKIVAVQIKPVITTIEKLSQRLLDQV